MFAVLNATDSLPSFTFVTFHMALSQETRQRFKQVTNSFAIQDDVERWIDVLFASARHFHTGCRCVILSDETTPLRPRPNAEIIRGAFVSGDPLWSRLNAEREFLKSLSSEKASSHVAFLDFDIIINNALDTLFTCALPESWDVGVTYRVFGDMPINGGVVLVRGGCYRKGLQFFDTLLDTYVARFRDEKWWGEQLSLASIVGAAGFQQQPQTVACNGFTVGLLPGSLYNHTPASASDLLRVAPEVSILHLKGKRKTFMVDYWRWRRFTANGTSSLPSPIVSLAAFFARTRILSRARHWG